MKKLLLGALGLVIIVVSIYGLSLKEAHFAYTSAEDTQKLEAKDTAATLLFTGDVMLGRNVEVLMGKYGKNYPFQKIDGLLKNVDAVVSNLEGPITYPHTLTPSNGFQFSFASTTAALIKGHNIQVVSLANNHTDNYGTSGFNQTEKFLDDAGVIHVGHPHTFSDTYVQRTSIGGQSFVFVAFNLTDSNLSMSDAFAFVKNIQHSKKEYVVAMVHGGTEYQLTSDPKQKQFYRGLVDAGVDAVIAHHPHVVEEIELYNGKPIFYSLGNFIFDQYFEKNVEQGLTLNLILTDTEARYELVPVKGNHSQPMVMDEAEKTAFLASLANRSKTVQQAVLNGELVFKR